MVFVKRARLIFTESVLFETLRQFAFDGFTMYPAHTFSIVAITSAFVSSTRIALSTPIIT